jgi:(p)ppGpp synthase/HD superfamily hydrolase
MPQQGLDAPALGPRFQEALQYASTLHGRQVRKGTQIPYVSHLLAVASLVLEDGGSEDEAIAALLHDAVEDQGGRKTLEEIRGRFGEKVAEIVQGCTDADSLPKPPWRARKERYIAHVRTASREVLRVSAADKLHNARAVLADYRTLGKALWKRFNGGPEGTLWYYRELTSVYKARGIGFFADELDRVVSELERLAKLGQGSPRRILRAKRRMGAVANSLSKGSRMSQRSRGGRS